MYFFTSCIDQDKINWEDLIIDIEQPKPDKFASLDSLSKIEQLQYALLPNKFYNDHLSTKITDQNIFKLFKARLYQKNFKNQKYVDLLTTLNFERPSNPLEAFIKEEAKHLVAKLKIAQGETLNNKLGYREKLNLRSFNISNLFEKRNLLRSLFRQTEIYLSESKIDEAFAINDAALYLIGLNDLDAILSFTAIELMAQKAKILEKENYSSSSKEIHNEILNIIDRLQLQVPKELYKINAAMSLFYADSIAAAKKIFDDLELQDFSSGDKIYFHCYQGDILYSQSLIEEAKTQYLSALALFKTSGCDVIKKSIHLYLADCNMELKDFKAMRSQVNLALDGRNCSDFDKKIIEYYSKETIKNYFRHQLIRTKNPIYLDSLIQVSLDERKLSEVVFLDKDALHLDDYYTYSCTEILGLFSSLDKDQLTDSYKIQMLRLIHNTKLREVKLEHLRQEKSKETTSDNPIDKRIRELKRVCNNHLRMDDYKNPIYLELYNLYVEKSTNQQIETQKAVPFDLEFDLTVSDISNNLKNKNAQVIEYLYYNNKYYYYYISPDTIELGIINDSIIENKWIDFRKNVQDKTSINNLDLISKTILPVNLDPKYQNIIINPDGPLSFFPFNTIIDSTYKVSSHIGLKSYLVNNLDTINSEAHFLSYSSVSSINQFDKILDIQELNGGLEECESVYNILGFGNKFYGADLNKTNFEKALASDFVHLSTHAHSDSSNRLDSYIFIRDEELHSIPYYAHDILSLDKVPKFINLSACDTGVGVHVNGEGTYSFSRSFLQKGSQAVLKTLWKVDDQATKEFMVLFYTNWKSGLSLGDALHQTKNTFRSGKWNAPYYWAGFVLEGNPYLYLNH